MKFKSTILEFDLVFQDTPDAASPLDHIKTNLSFDISQPGLPDKKMTVEAFTYFYDTSATPTNLRYSRASLDERDIEAIRKTKYDPTFWANNPVVRRTPVEDEVVQSFEKKGAFGTMISK